MTILDTVIFEQSSIIRTFIKDAEKQGFGPAIVWQLIILRGHCSRIYSATGDCLTNN